ncbi:hypothetical protein FCM35_KLT15140 [Carex littledalei]|uniref:CCHC-type domain-containing protein n=1 Tax=Carex littledalei TaxID=544730 RepID=A0A833VD68_9POAL|nr:hypothetical protein FCM35_KLT15140 [Carex littledalei]
MLTKCGDCGHRASDCHNAVLCYACDQIGHRSSRCRAVIAVKPSANNLTVKTDDLTTTPQPLIPSAIGPESVNKSIPVYCEVSVISSIKRLETELAAIKQELARVKAMAGINVASGLCEVDVANSTARYSTSNSSNSNKKEANRGDTVPVTPVTARSSTSNSSNPVPVTPVTETIHEAVVTNSAQLITVPVTLVDQNSWVSQITRTKKKTKSGSIELNNMNLSREKKNIQFKRVATKGTEREEKKEPQRLLSDLSFAPLSLSLSSAPSSQQRLPPPVYPAASSDSLSLGNKCDTQRPAAAAASCVPSDQQHSTVSSDLAAQYETVSHNDLCGTIPTTGPFEHIPLNKYMSS